MEAYTMNQHIRHIYIITLQPLGYQDISRFIDYYLVNLDIDAYKLGNIKLVDPEKYQQYTNS